MTIDNQAYFWEKDWQAAEQEADDDIAAGRFKTFDSVDELIQDLRFRNANAHDKK